MGADICFSLRKYSHASGTRTDGSIPWTHISSNNLFIIVKGTDRSIANEQLTLRIVQGNDVLVRPPPTRATSLEANDTAGKPRRCDVYQQGI